MTTAKWIELEPFAYACAGATGAFVTVGEWFVAGFWWAVFLTCVVLIGRKAA